MCIYPRKLVQHSWSVLLSICFCCLSVGAFGIGAIEHVMEHIAKTVKKNPIEVRINNINKDHDQLLQMINELKISSDYEGRQQSIKAYNKASVNVLVDCAPATKQLLMLCMCMFCLCYVACSHICKLYVYYTHCTII